MLDSRYGGYSLRFAAIDATLRIFVLPKDQAASHAAAPLGMLLSNKSILVPAVPMGLAAFGWGIVEPLLPEQLAKFGVAPWLVALIFTTATIMYGLSAPLVSWTTKLVPVKRVIAGGTICMALSLVLLGWAPNAFLAAAALCLLSISFAFALNPTSAELGKAVDRLGLTCYAAVYAVYNIAYSIGKMATGALATVVMQQLGFLNTLMCAALGLVLCTPFLLQKKTVKPA